MNDFTPGTITKQYERDMLKELYERTAKFATRESNEQQECLDMYPLALLEQDMQTPTDRLTPEEAIEIIESKSCYAKACIIAIEDVRKPTRTLKKEAINGLERMINAALDAIERIGNPDWKNPANLSAANAAYKIELHTKHMRDRLSDE